MQSQAATKILISSAWKDADLCAPPEFTSIAFVVEGYPMPIAGFFEDGAFHQCMWDDRSRSIQSRRVNASVDRWRFLEIGTREESESSFAVLEGDR